MDREAVVRGEDDDDAVEEAGMRRDGDDATRWANACSQPDAVASSTVL